MMPSGSSESSTVVVTGATGLLGRHVVWRLLEAGYPVRAAVRATSDRAMFAGLDLEFVEADLNQPGTLPRVVAGAAVVVHTAAAIESGLPEATYQQANVAALEHLLASAAQSLQPPRWIQISSLDVYPPRDHLGTAETEPIDLDSLDDYPRSKAEADLLVSGYVGQGHPGVILRPGLLYGPGDRHLLPELGAQLRAGRLRLLNPDQILHNTAACNLADAVLLAIEQEAALGEVFHITDGRLITAGELAEAVAVWNDCEHPTTSGSWLTRLTGNRLSHLHGRQLQFSIDKAKRLLGYEPAADFTTAIREALEV